MICEDTVLFPEGGGQNSDHGEMAGWKVLQVVVVVVHSLINTIISIVLMITITIRWTGKETRQFTL